MAAPVPGIKQKLRKTMPNRAKNGAVTFILMVIWEMMLDGWRQVMERVVVMEVFPFEDSLVTFGLIGEGCVPRRGGPKEIDLREG